MLPQQLLAVRGIGDTRAPYWLASTLDGTRLLLEPGESLRHVCRCRVVQLSPETWVLPDCATVAVTDRRVGFLSSRVPAGGEIRPGDGSVVVGHVRYEWLSGITLRRLKALTVSVSARAGLSVPTAAGPGTVELRGRAAVTEDFARLLAGAAASHRAALLGPAVARGGSGGSGGHDAVPARRAGLVWSFPGQSDELIAAAIAAQATPPDAADLS